MAAGLTLAVLLAYQPAWRAGFIWDDEAHVTRPHLQSWQGLDRIWFDLGATQQYYPLLHSFFWVEHKLWGDAAIGYHLTNILLHAAVAIMVALVLRRLSVPGAYLAAAIFALHPVNVESVAWITEQKNTLSAVFYLGAMLVYFHFDQTRRRSLYCCALGLFVLGLLSKTVTATLPAALLVIFWWQRGELSWRRDVAPLIPFFLLGAVAGVFTAAVEHGLIGAKGPAFEMTIVERCLIAGRAPWFYLGKLFWPAELVFIYPRWQVSQTVWWQYLFPAATALLLAVAWILRHRWRGPLAALLFFIGTLFPVLGFCNVYPFQFSFVADHFQYLASLGIITLVAAGAVLTLTHWGLWRRPAGYAACLTLLTILGCLTWRQSRIYDTSESIWRTTLARNPDCWLAHNGLGVVLRAQGKLDEAIVHYRRSVELNPRYDLAHNNLAAALHTTGKIEEGIAEMRRTVELRPEVADFRYNLGLLLLAGRKADEAIAEFKQAVAITPAYANAHSSLGSALAAQGRFDEAVVHYRQALTIRPDWASMQNDLAWLLATCPVASLRNGAEAVEHAERADKLSGGRQPAMLDTLAAAYAEAGRFPEALATARKALQLAAQHNMKALADAVQNRIILYQAGKPYREASSRPITQRATLHAPP